MGAGKRDVLASFLSALALWLVVIQVGIPPEYMSVAFLAACLLFVNTDWADTLDSADRYEFARFDTDCYDSISRDPDRHRLNHWNHMMSSPTPRCTGISQLLALYMCPSIEKDNKNNRVMITTFDVVVSYTQRPTWVPIRPCTSSMIYRARSPPRYTGRDHTMSTRIRRSVIDNELCRLNSPLLAGD